MRILISTCPYPGHLGAHVPLASELLDRGHRVVFATEPGFCGAVRDAGFPCGAVGSSGPLPAGPAGVPHAKCAGLVELGETILPDVIVADEQDLAAMVAAEALGVPCVTLGFTEFTRQPAWDTVARPALRELRSRWARGGGRGGGPDEVPLAGHLNLVPRAFRRYAALRGERALRPVCRQQRGSLAPVPWLDRLPARPTIHVMLDTARINLMAGVAGWLSAQPVSVICTAERGSDLAVIGSSGSGGSGGSIGERDNVYITGGVPLEQVLRHCDATVTSGGFNAVMAALQFGLPMLVVPLSTDQEYIAGKIADLGAGIRMTAADLTRDTVPRAVRHLLIQPAHRVIAARLQEQIERMPGPEEAAAYLERQAQGQGTPPLAGHL